MSSTILHVLSRPLSKTRDSFVNWTDGKLSCICFSASFKNCFNLASDEAFKKTFGHLHISYMISPWDSIWRVRRPSFVDTSRTALLSSTCSAQSPMHLAKSATPSGSRRLQSSMNFGSRDKQITSITVCKNISLPLKLCHSDVTDVLSWRLLFVEINGN